MLLFLCFKLVNSNPRLDHDSLRLLLGFVQDFCALACRMMLWTSRNESDCRPLEIPLSGDVLASHLYPDDLAATWLYKGIVAAGPTGPTSKALEFGL